MHTSQRPYIPAAGVDAALPFYDPLTILAGARARRGRLLDRAGLRAGQRVLDLGCGTGELSLAIKRAQPALELCALDPDPLALARARAKAERAGVRVELQQGFGDALPYAAGTFARVLSSFVLHHLDLAAQRRVLSEVLRVLAPGGSFHVLDFARSAQRQLELDLREVGFSDTQCEPEPRWLFQRIVYACGTRAA